MGGRGEEEKRIGGYHVTQEMKFVGSILRGIFNDHSQNCKQPSWGLETN